MLSGAFFTEQMWESPFPTGALQTSQTSIDFLFGAPFLACGGRLTLLAAPKRPFSPEILLETVLMWPLPFFNFHMAFLSTCKANIAIAGFVFSSSFFS